MRPLPACLALALALAACAPRAERPDVLPGPPAASHPAAFPAADAPTVRAWPVMGTLLEVTVWEADSVRARAALAAARAAVFRVDTLMSVYRPESELSVVNRRAGTDSATVVSPETAEVLAEALRVAALSDGALDVTVGPLVEVWGFYRQHGAFPPRAARDSAARLVGWSRVRFDPATRRVGLPARGMRLDFGAIAKGYAVDRGVAALRAAGVERGMVDLGGNVRVFGAAPDGEDWVLGLRDPRAPDQVFAAVALDSGALATSGDYEQFFVHQGVRYSHVFDPRTGEPSQGVAAVSVVAPGGMASDAWSTPFLVVGVEEGCRLAATLPGIEVVWVEDAGGDPAAPVDPAHVVVTPGLADRLALLLGEDGPEQGPPPEPRVCGEGG